MNILVSVLGGIVAGWLAGLLMRGSGFGLIGDLVVGLLGGLLGSWLAGLLGIPVTNWAAQLAVAVVGAIVLVVLLRLISRLTSI
jgi:uncharacterized membrane protein YeaQ/YmgE (transglycosylase-associated protein family)